MKKTLLLIMLLFGAVVCSHAQLKQNVYLLKKDGREVKYLDSADFIRIIREPENGKRYFKLIEYYKDKSIKRTGEVSAYSPYLELTNEVISYYENGQIEQREFYKNNKTIDTAWYYFNNGNLKESRFYHASLKEELYSHPRNTNYKTIQVGDISGLHFLDANSSGYIKRYISKYVVEEGLYQNGLKEGVWKENNLENKTSYEEIYEDGAFVSGLYKDELGTVTKYTSLNILPEFKGGITRFYRFLSQNLIYPEQEQNSGKSGRVVLNFIVEKDGSLTNISILQSLSPLFDDEAIRVLSLSPKWKPGIIRGLPSRVGYSVPVMFSLGN